MAQRTIRDFIYLDTERVRSFAAQMLEGIPETAAFETGNEASIGGSVEGQIPLLTRGKAEADYRYHRSHSETRSLHHHMYNLLEARLDKAGKLRDVDADFVATNWHRASLPDGQLIRVRGHVRLTDYAAIVQLLREFPQLANLVSKIQKLALGNHAAGGTGGQKLDFGLSQKQFESIGELVQRIWGDAVRIKVRPSMEHPERLLVGSAPREGFTDGAEATLQSHGWNLTGNWTVVGQVNAPSPDEADAMALPFLTGNEMEDGLDGATALSGGIRQLISTVQFPCVSMAVVSIYREF
jgi:hypothetical protein